MDLYRFSPNIKLIRVLIKHDECMQVLEGDDSHFRGGLLFWGRPNLSKKK